MRKKNEKKEGKEKQQRLGNASANSNFTVDSLSSFSIHKMRLVSHDFLTYFS